MARSGGGGSPPRIGSARKARTRTPPSERYSTRNFLYGSGSRVSSMVAVMGSAASRARVVFQKPAMSCAPAGRARTRSAIKRSRSDPRLDRDSTAERFGYLRQRLRNLLQREIDVALLMGVRDGALLGRQREHIHTELDDRPAQRFVDRGVVICGQIVPIDGQMIHEVETKRRPLASHRRLDSQG